MTKPEAFTAGFNAHWKHMERYVLKPMGRESLPETYDELKEMLNDAFVSGFECGEDFAEGKY